MLDALGALTSPLLAGVLGDTLAVVMVYFVAHQVLQVSSPDVHWGRLAACGSLARVSRP